MPLPDERRGHGVAALIGRFEQTNKRHSITASSSSTSPPSSSTPIVIPGRPSLLERQSSIGNEVGLGRINARGSRPTPETPISPAERTVELQPGTAPVPVNEASASSDAELVVILHEEELSVPAEPHPTPSPIAAPHPSTSPSTPKVLVRQPSTPPTKSGIPQKSGGPATRPRTGGSVVVPPSSTPRALRAQHTGTSTTSTPAIRPQHTGASSTSVSAHPPIRPQVTGGGRAGHAPKAAAPSTPLRSKTPTSSRPPAARTPLTAPTASSLAKARQPASAASSPSAIKKPAARATPASSIPKPAAASSVAFPSARKPKTSAAAATVPGTRKPRISQGGGRGPSADALAAVAAVRAGKAPPMPTKAVPHQDTLTVAAPSVPIPRSVSASPTPPSSAEVPIPDSTVTIPTASPAVVVVSDDVEGSVTAPVAARLTEAALDQHDDAVDHDHLDDVVAMLELGPLISVGMAGQSGAEPSVSMLAVSGEEAESAAELAPGTHDASDVAKVEIEDIPDEF